MLESTDLNVQEVMDNTDVYSKEFLNGDMSEYAQAFENQNNN